MGGTRQTGRAAKTISSLILSGAKGNANSSARAMELESNVAVPAAERDGLAARVERLKTNPKERRVLKRADVVDLVDEALGERADCVAAELRWAKAKLRNCSVAIKQAAYKNESVGRSFRRGVDQLARVREEVGEVRMAVKPRGLRALLDKASCRAKTNSLCFSA